MPTHCLQGDQVVSLIPRKLKMHPSFGPTRVPLRDPLDQLIDLGTAHFYHHTGKLCGSAPASGSASRIGVIPKLTSSLASAENQYRTRIYNPMPFAINLE
jgi:hypothetical protein